MAPPEQTQSWFVALGEFCTKMAMNLFIQLTPCVRMPEDYQVDVGQYRHSNLRGIALENRESMGLLAAAFTGRESKARELLALPWTNINAQYGNGNTPLILAAQSNNERLVRLMLDHPCINVNIRGLDGCTALHRACSHEKTEIVGMLLTRSDTDVNIASYYGSTPLTNAIRAGNEEAVQLLLMRRDLDVNYQSRHGENALLEAITFQKFDIARALINRADIEVDILDSRDRTPLVLAAQYGYVLLVRQLLFAGADPSTEDDQNQTALHYALRRGSAEIVHDLLETLAQPQPLTRMCRTVIRRTIRNKVGRNQKIKPAIDRFQRHEVPVRLKKFIAYETS